MIPSSDQRDLGPQERRQRLTRTSAVEDGSSGFDEGSRLAGPVCSEPVDLQRSRSGSVSANPGSDLETASCCSSQHSIEVESIRTISPIEADFPSTVICSGSPPTPVKDEPVTAQPKSGNLRLVHPPNGQKSITKVPDDTPVPVSPLSGGALRTLNMNPIPLLDPGSSSPNQADRVAGLRQRNDFAGVRSSPESSKFSRGKSLMERLTEAVADDSAMIACGFIYLNGSTSALSVSYEFEFKVAQLTFASMLQAYYYVKCIVTGMPDLAARVKSVPLHLLPTLAAEVNSSEEDMDKRRLMLALFQLKYMQCTRFARICDLLVHQDPCYVFLDHQDSYLGMELPENDENPDSISGSNAYGTIFHEYLQIRKNLASVPKFNFDMFCSAAIPVKSPPRTLVIADAAWRQFRGLFGTQVKFAPNLRLTGMSLCPNISTLCDMVFIHGRWADFEALVIFPAFSDSEALSVVDLVESLNHVSAVFRRIFLIDVWGFCDGYSAWLTLAVEQCADFAEIIQIPDSFALLGDQLFAENGNLGPEALGILFQTLAVRIPFANFAGTEIKEKAEGISRDPCAIKRLTKRWIAKNKAMLRRIEVDVSEKSKREMRITLPKSYANANCVDQKEPDSKKQKRPRRGSSCRDAANPSIKGDLRAKLEKASNSKKRRKNGEKEGKRKKERISPIRCPEVHDIRDDSPDTSCKVSNVSGLDAVGSPVRNVKDMLTPFSPDTIRAKIAYIDSRLGSKVSALPVAESPVRKVKNMLTPFSPDTIRAKIAYIDSRLEVLGVDASKLKVKDQKRKKKKKLIATNQEKANALLWSAKQLKTKNKKKQLRSEIVDLNRDGQTLEEQSPAQKKKKRKGTKSGTQEDDGNFLNWPTTSNDPNSPAKPMRDMGIAVQQNESSCVFSSAANDVISMANAAGFNSPPEKHQGSCFPEIPSPSAAVEKAKEIQAEVNFIQEQVVWNASLSIPSSSPPIADLDPELDVVSGKKNRVPLKRTYLSAQSLPHYQLPPRTVSPSTAIPTIVSEREPHPTTNVADPPVPAMPLPQAPFSYQGYPVPVVMPLFHQQPMPQVVPVLAYPAQMVPPPRPPPPPVVYSVYCSPGYTADHVRVPADALIPGGPPNWNAK